MPASEITQWQAYEQVTGALGPQRLDILVSILAAVVANTMRGRGRRVRAVDFLPRWDRPPETDWRQTRAAFLVAFGIQEE